MSALTDEERDERQRMDEEDRWDRAEESRYDEWVEKYNREHWTEDE